MGKEHTRRLMESLGISRICGTPARICIPGVYEVQGFDNQWQKVRADNDEALQLRAYYGDFYIPGFRIHADYLRESCEEIERMEGEGVRLIGELIPYCDGWGQKYDCENMDKLLDMAEAHHMVVSFHSMDEDAMDAMVEKHKKLVLVGAHPGEYGEFMRHMERMKKSENYYLDISGYGIFRYGMLRHAVDEFGAERFLFGSDYPACIPAMYVGGVLMDNLLDDHQKRLIFAENTKRLLGLE